MTLLPAAGQTETDEPSLPLIPAHWKLLRIKNVGRALIGLTYAPDEIVDDTDTATLVLRAGNIQSGRLDFSDNVYVNTAVPDDLRLRRGDIVICARNGSAHLIGKNAVATSEVEGQTWGAFMVVLRSDHNDYLRWVLNSRIFQAQTGLYSTTTINQLTSATLHNLRFAMPPAHERRAIASYLDRETARIDTLIEEQHRLVELLLERRVSAISDSIERNFPTKPLGALLDELIDHRGKTPSKMGGVDFSEEGVPVVSAVHIKNGHISWAERERFVPAWMFDKWMPVRLRKSDVLLTSEAPLGNVAQVPNNEPLVLSQRLFALRGKNGVLDSTFLRYYLESERGQAVLRDRASGSTVSGIRQSKLVQIPVPVPSLTEQRQIVSHLDEQTAKIDCLIAETERFIELSRERRSALITAAVTGLIDVQEFA